MRRIFVLLFALAFLPTLCLAGSIDNVTNYQINITANWIETNPSCVSNCTETMNISYKFESNNDVFNPNSPTSGVYGWVPMDTMQVTASGFLGSFALSSVLTPSSDVWEDDGNHLSGGLPFFNGSFLNPQTDEIDLGNQGPGLSNSGPPLMYIYNCFSNDCTNAYPGVYPHYIFANNETSTAVQMPAFDSAWELLLISAIACTFGFFVKHRLGLTPSR